jgi:hypothetical protein
MTAELAYAKNPAGWLLQNSGNFDSRTWDQVSGQGRRRIL